MRRLLILGALLTAVPAALAAFTRRRPARTAEGETARVRDLYDRVATWYDSMIRIPERLVFADGRAWAAAHAMGDALEIAIGTGRNIRHYAPAVRLTGQDVSRQMLLIARARADTLGREVKLTVGDAQHLAFPSGRFDSVVATLALCTIPDDRRALAEAWRVLRPGGRLVLFEHVRSPRPSVRLVQRLLEPLACRFAGDHLLRDPLDHLGSLGYSVEYCARSHAGLVERLVASKVHTRFEQTSGDRHHA